jgi:hypothetical protein
VRLPEIRGGGAVIVFAFIAILVATLAFGAWIAARLCRAGYELDAALAEQQRDWDICDEAASAETACDWGGEL